MRRKDREVTDFNKILEIIDTCSVIRIGLADGDFPYIVPLNFGYEIDGQQIYFYIHGAMAGRKYDLMKKSPWCSFEMDNPLGIDCIYERKDVTMRYHSVMGKARIDFLEGEDKLHGMELLMNRDIQTKNFDYNKAVLKHTALIRLTVIEMSAKSNPFPQS